MERETLKKILAIFDGERTASLAAVAEELHASEDLVRAALEYLELHGYVGRVSVPECTVSCPLRDHCASSGRCALASAPPLWKRLRPS
jgi:predicted ArsR family transcriptional regulator